MHDDVTDRLDQIAAHLLALDSQSGEGQTIAGASVCIAQLRLCIRRYMTAVRELTALREKPDRTYMNMDLIKDDGCLAAWQELDAAGKGLSAAMDTTYASHFDRSASKTILEKADQ